MKRVVRPQNVSARRSDRIKRVVVCITIRTSQSWSCLEVEVPEVVSAVPRSFFKRDSRTVTDSNNAVITSP